ncbi:MAG: hypothetical protein WD042_01375 [Phycisphaeraceae bacterium]
MQNLPSLDVARRAIRAEVCRQCSQRPTGSEDWPPTFLRPCEAGCTIFINLPQLDKLAHKLHATSLAPYDRAVRMLVCDHCQASPNAGDYCPQRQIQSCPLTRYMNLVIETLERLPRALPQREIH